MNDKSLDPNISVWLESSGLDPKLAQLSDLDLTVGISRPSVANLTIVTEDPYGVDREALLRNPATLHVTWRSDLHRNRHGMIAGVEERYDPRKGAFTYQIRMVPRLWRLSLRSRLRVHANRSVPEVIRETLTSAGFQEGIDFDLRLREDYPKRDYNIQYRESDLDFLRRLTEHWGISFFFEHHAGRDVVIFADANIFWGKAFKDEPLDFNAGGLKQAIYEFRSDRQHVPERYILRDYNYRLPKVGLQSEIRFDHGIGGEEVEYGANFRNEAEAALLTRSRRDEILAHSNIFRGRCAEPVLSVGKVFTMQGHPHFGDRRFVVIDRHVRFKQTTFLSGPEDRSVHDQEFTAALAEIDYRPARTARKPRIDGVLHGVIEPQAEKDYGHVDEDGCYRVRLLVDEPAETGGSPYPVVRLSQPSGGKGYGFHFPLRPGTEVMMSFVEGDPDRPIITGTAPNPADRTPVAAGNHSRNVIRTESGNQIDFDDTKDGSRIKFDTPYEQTSLQLGSPNGPEAGIWAQTNGSIEAVGSISTGWVSPIQTAIASYVDTKSHFILSEAEKPKAWTWTAKADTAFDAVAGLASYTYGVGVTLADKAQSGWELNQKIEKGKLADIERRIRGLDPENKTRSLQRETANAVLKPLGRLGLEAEMRTRLGKKKTDPIDLSEIATLKKDEALAPVSEPLKSFVEFAALENELNKIEDDHKKACAGRSEALGNFDEEAVAAAEAKLAKLDLEAPYAKLVAAANTLCAALKAAKSRVPEADRAAYEEDQAAACGTADELTEGIKEQKGHRQLIDRIKYCCENEKNLAIFKRHVTATDNFQSARFYGENISGSLGLLLGLRNMYKGGKKAIKKMSDAKKLLVGGQVTATLATENTAHNDAWKSLRDSSASGSRVFGQSFVPSAQKGSGNDIMGLVHVTKALNLVGSEHSTVVYGKDKMMMHAPLAVLAGMAVEYPGDTPSVGGGNGTVAVLGKDVALVSSEKATEIQSLGTVLVTSKKINAHGEEKLEISIGDPNKDPHKITIDSAGLKISVTEDNKKVVVDAPSSEVSVTGKKVTLTADDIVLTGNKSITMDTPDLKVTGKAMTVESKDVKFTGDSFDATVSNTAMLNGSTSATVKSGSASFTASNGSAEVAGGTSTTIKGKSVEVQVS